MCVKGHAMNIEKQKKKKGGGRKLRALQYIGLRNVCDDHACDFISSIAIV